MPNCDTCGDTGRISVSLLDHERERGVMLKVVACPECHPAGGRIREIRELQRDLSDDAQRYEKLAEALAESSGSTAS
jgi:hypothetical protein